MTLNLPALIRRPANQTHGDRQFQRTCTRSYSLLETASRAAQRGFTLTELTVASVALLFGVVAVMQLVPATLQANLRNRHDTTAVVIAQRELDQMLTQPISATQFIDADGRVIALGDPTPPNVVVGGPAKVAGTTMQIDAASAAVSNYNFTYVDPNDASGTPYEVRWAVITRTVGGTAVSKRFIVGARPRGPARNAPLVTVEGVVEK